MLPVPGPLTVITAVFDGVDAVLSDTSKREGYDAQRGSFLTLRINLPPRGNGAFLTKKPDTESRVAQGSEESPNPSESVLPPP